MSKEKPKRLRKSLALKPPFSREELIAWGESLPKSSKIRVVTVSSPNRVDVTSFLEAIFWETGDIDRS